MIIIFAHIKFSRMEGPAQNARKDMHCAKNSTFTVYDFNVAYRINVHNVLLEVTVLKYKTSLLVSRNDR